MHEASEKADNSGRKASARKVATRSTEDRAFHVSVENGKIVLDPLVSGMLGDSVSLEDVLFAGEGDDPQSTDGLAISAEIVAQAKADKVTVFKKKRRHNYRRKRGHRQQLTILKIVAIGDRKAVKKALEEVAGESSDQPSMSTTIAVLDDTRELEALAQELNSAAVRMEEHLDRAIGAVRAALDPKCEAASRKRYEAEFAGTGHLLLAGLG
jgi:ribosomal protein L21